MAAAQPEALSEAARELAAQLEHAIATESLELPPLPGVATEVLASASGEQADAKRLAALIQRDQSLASHVMRVVNSALFRGSVEVVSLQQAIARLGMERVRDIAFTAAVSAVLLEGSAFENIVRDAWRASLSTGLWAKEIARVTRKNVELAYLAGLFHNVGVPLVVRFVEKHGATVDHTTIDELIERFGPSAAAMLVTAWKLPANLADVLQRYQRWQEASPPDDLCLMTAAAVQFSSTLQACPDIEEASAGLVGSAECNALNFYPEEVAELLGRADDVRQTMESMA